MNADLHDVEQRLRDATNAFADEVPISSDAWAHLRGRIDAEPTARRRRVRATAGFAFAGALAAAAIVAVVAISGGSDGGLRVETPPATGPTPTESAGPGIAYVTQDVIVVLDAAGNDVARHATSGEGHVADVQALGTDADASFASLRLADGARCGALALTGPGELAAPFVEGEIAAFAYSPDGTRLATATGCVSQLEFLVVQPLSGGDEQVWAHEPGLDDDLPLHVDSIAWSPDGTRLAVGLCYESCSIALIDPTTSGRLVDAPTLAVGRNPVWLDDHRVVFVHGPESEGGPEPATTHEMRWVDVDTSETGMLLGDLGATQVTDLDADPASGHLLLLHEDGTLVGWDGTELHDVATSVRAATFVPLDSLG